MRKVQKEKYGTCTTCGTHTNEWWYFDHLKGLCKCTACSADIYKGRQLDIFEELDLPPVPTNRGGSNTTPSTKKIKKLPQWKLELSKMLENRN